MLKPEHQVAVNRSGFRYWSDQIDSQWSISALMPPAVKRVDRSQTLNILTILSDIFYVLGTGCQWRAIP